MILSWDEIEEDLAYPGEGANVVIFDTPWILSGEYPSIYRQLSPFFRPDPAGRVARPADEQA